VYVTAARILLYNGIKQQQLYGPLWGGEIKGKTSIENLNYLHIIQHQSGEK
jgi:hypothetical protein